MAMGMVSRRLTAMAMLVMMVQSSYVMFSCSKISMYGGTWE